MKTYIMQYFLLAFQTVAFFFYIDGAQLEKGDGTHCTIIHLNQNMMKVVGLFGHSQTNLIDPHPHSPGF